MQCLRLNITWHWFFFIVLLLFYNDKCTIISSRAEILLQSLKWKKVNKIRWFSPSSPHLFFLLQLRVGGWDKRGLLRRFLICLHAGWNSFVSDHFGADETNTSVFCSPNRKWNEGFAVKCPEWELLELVVSLVPQPAAKMSFTAPSRFSEHQEQSASVPPVPFPGSPGRVPLAPHIPPAAVPGACTPMVARRSSLESWPEERQRGNQGINPLRRFVTSSLFTRRFSLVFVRAGPSSDAVFTWRPLFELGLFRMRGRKSRTSWFYPSNKEL